MMIELRPVSFFRCYLDVFAFADEQLGKTSLAQHVIDKSDAMPIKQRPYRTSLRCKQESDRQVDDMLQKGIIRESVSPCRKSRSLQKLLESKKKNGGSHAFRKII